MTKPHLTSSAQELARIAVQLKQRAAAAGRTPAPFDLAFLTDEKTADVDAAIAGLPKGRDISCAVIMRHYTNRDRAKLATRWQGTAQTAGHLFLVAGDAALAARLDADGLHLQASQLPCLKTVRKKHPQWIITAACHNAAELEAAAEGGACAAFLSPVFETTSHPGTHPLGVEEASKLALGTLLPVIALGGVNAHNAQKLLSTEFQGIGAIDALADIQIKT